MATIDSNKSYWIVETFAQMLFDKNVTDVDLESEKGAVQTEIGDYKLSEVLLRKITQFFKKVSPTQNNIYRDDFGLTPEPELPARYFSKQNNTLFSLDQVMAHYKAYYYPSNMKLIVVGKFDEEKMKQLIETHYGRYHNGGTKTVVKPVDEPRLSHKPYHSFVEGLGKNHGYIGAKYILSDYKKYIVLDAYTESAALRIQQHLRNKLGHTYSVSALHTTERKASIAGVSFDGLHDDFENNLQYVEQKLKDDVSSIDDATIEAALNAYATQVYAYKEHDSDSLMQRVDVVEYLREEHNITDKTSYEIFSSISNDEFRKIIKTVFVPENEYKIIFRDYYFFAYDVQIFTMLIFILYALVYFKISRIDYYKKGLHYTKRDICFDRRLSNRFLGFLTFITIFTVSSIIGEWVKHLLLTVLMDDPYYLNTIDVPYSYLVTVGDGLFGLVVFTAMYRYIFPYAAYMDVTKEHIYLVGNKITVITNNMINKIEVTPWRVMPFIKIHGSVFLFWRSLVKVEMKDGSSVYLRTSAPEHLKEDLEKCLERIPKERTTSSIS